MKKKYRLWLVQNNGLLKMLRIMRLTIFILLFTITQSFAVNSYSQSTKLTLNYKNVRVEEIIDAIEANSEFYFLYNKDMVDVDRKVNVNVEQKSVTQVLDQVFANTDIAYSIRDRLILLIKKEMETSIDNFQEQLQRKITGTITDNSGLPLPGVSVIIKNTSTGTITNANGEYTITDVPEDAVLQFSFVGMRTQEIPVNGQNNINVVLQEETIGIEEVIAVGYGTQKKESLTGSLQMVESERLQSTTTPTVENMLSGKVPGVFVASGSGQPGSEGNIVIRGKSTINGNTDPLWVIDGVIVGSDAGALNPADIETMTILKDAASTSIYGSQGANGVIVVTTKQAKAEKMSINVSAKFGVTNLYNGNLEVMNGAELYDLYQSFSNADEIAFPRWNEDLRNSNFDWWDFASQTGVVQDYNISVNGGNEKLKSFFSAGLYDEEGAVKGYDYTRYNFRYKTDYTPFKWLTLKPTIAGSRKDIDDRQYDVTAMYSNLPWDSPYDEEGNIVDHYSSLWVNSNSTNYLYDLQWNYSESKTWEFMGNFDFDIKFTDWLTFSSVNNYKWVGYSTMTYSDPRSSGAEGVGGRIDEYQSNMNRRYTNQILRFNKTQGDHSINALVAYEFNDYYFKSISGIGTGIVAGFDVLDVTSKPEAVKGSVSEWAVQSYLFNANYSYKSRYYGQLSLRRDGASNFGNKEKYGNFFSIGGGWIISREDWIDTDWVNVLKLRASYGSVGNRPNSLYPQYDLYSVSESYNEEPGALISQVGNDELTWERTFTSGIGIDATLFSRLRLTVDYYSKNTDNLLYKVPVSGVTGVTSIWRNVGELENKGFETTVGVDIIKNSDLYWAVDANLGLNRNKVVKLYDNNSQIILGSDIAGSANRILRPGIDSDTWYMREWAGVDPENGDPLWYTTDEDGNRVTTNNYAEADQVELDAYTPDFFGGFSTTLRYKKFDMNANFNYSVGGKIYNYTRSEYDSDGAYTDRNQMRLMDDWSRWEKPGDIATHPLPSYNNSSNSNKVSSRYLEDGDYLKMKNLTIGYNFTLPAYKISNVRLYLSGENLFTITDYSGVDPEIPPKDDKITGETTTVYPSTRKFIFGVNVTL